MLIFCCLSYLAILMLVFRFAYLYFVSGGNIAEYLIQKYCLADEIMKTVIISFLIFFGFLLLDTCKYEQKLNKVPIKLGYLIQDNNKEFLCVEFNKERFEDYNADLISKFKQNPKSVTVIYKDYATIFFPQPSAHSGTLKIEAL